MTPDGFPEQIVPLSLYSHSPGHLSLVLSLSVWGLSLVGYIGGQCPSLFIFVASVLFLERIIYTGCHTNKAALTFYVDVKTVDSLQNKLHSL